MSFSLPPSLSLSLSIMGEPSALGVIPQFANELYDRIEGTADDEVSGELIFIDYSSFPTLTVSLSLSLRPLIKWRSVILRYIRKGFMTC